MENKVDNTLLHLEPLPLEEVIDNQIKDKRLNDSNSVETIEEKSHDFSEDNLNDKWPKKCDHCDYVGKLYKYMYRHIREKHPEFAKTPLPLRKCDAEGCNFETRNKMSWIKHSETHTKSRVFQCSQKGCKKIYKFHHLLVAHLTNEHRKGSIFVCEKFRYNKSKNVHEVCYRKFDSADELKRHINKLHPEKANQNVQLVCPKCDKTCKTKKGLTDHLKRTKCGSSLLSPNKQNNVMKLNTSGPKKPSTLIVYKCKIPSCGQMFQDIEEFKQHEQIHTINLTQQPLFQVTTTSGLGQQIQGYAYTTESSISIFDPANNDVSVDLMESNYDPCPTCQEDRGLRRKRSQDWNQWMNNVQRYGTSYFAPIPCPENELRNSAVNILTKQDLLRYVHNLPDDIELSSIFIRSKTNIMMNI